MLLVSKGNRLSVNNIQLCITRIQILCPTLQSSRKKIDVRIENKGKKSGILSYGSVFC